jgi:hypothetical protein
MLNAETQSGILSVLVSTAKSASVSPALEG